MGDRWTAETYPYLRRYTSLPILLDMLSNRRVTLVDPSRWMDKNDAAFLAAYRDAKSLNSLCALCFTATGETFHHWNVFASGSAGVCIEFNRLDFLTSLGSPPGLRQGLVRYAEIRELEEEPLEADALPFLKRYPYRDEVEYRLVWEDVAICRDSKDFNLDLGSINRIFLSPWHPREISRSTADVIHTLAESHELTVHRTTVLENARWKGKLKHLAIAPIQERDS